jgi:hypothetical protein
MRKGGKEEGTKERRNEGTKEGEGRKEPRQKRREERREESRNQGIKEGRKEAKDMHKVVVVRKDLLFVPQINDVRDFDILFFSICMEEEEIRED